MSCTGSSSSPHHFCADCLNNYASTSFQHGECYSREQHSSNSLISKRGQLPCPYFTSHQCSCNELNIFSLIGIVTPEVQEQWKQALGRLTVIADGEAAKKANDQITVAIAQNSPLDLLVAAVAEILFCWGTHCLPPLQPTRRKGRCLHAHFVQRLWMSLLLLLWTRTWSCKTKPVLDLRFQQPLS
jgi:hypothetical protein